MSGVVSEWKEMRMLAALDLDTAEYILASSKPHYRIACFLAQQSSEKYLKAFLGANGHEPDDGKTHNLTTLLFDCFDIDKSLECIFDECNTLKFYAVAPRYPGFKKDAPPERLAQFTAEAIFLAKKIESELVARCPLLSRSEFDETRDHESGDGDSSGIPPM